MKPNRQEIKAVLNLKDKTPKEVLETFLSAIQYFVKVRPILSG